MRSSELQEGLGPLFHLVSFFLELPPPFSTFSMPAQLTSLSDTDRSTVRKEGYTPARGLLSCPHLQITPSLSDPGLDKALGIAEATSS